MSTNKKKKQLYPKMNISNNWQQQIYYDEN